jgi:hypothetical protein
MKYIIVSLLLTACVSTVIDASFITKLKKDQKALVQHKEYICKGDCKDAVLGQCSSSCTNCHNC